MVIKRDEILRRIKEEKLIEGYIDIEEQIQSNGFDLTLNKILKVKKDLVFRNVNGYLLPVKKGIDNIYEELKFQKDGFILLGKGEYSVVFNEYFNIPYDLVGLVFPRSSFLRMGIRIHTAIWDSGYSGSGMVLMVIPEHLKVYLQKNMRIAQILFLKADKKDRSVYRGFYQREDYRK